MAVLALLALLLGLCCLPADAFDFIGKVVKVSDGDTIVVLHDGIPEKIRLAEIDCPEKKQAFGTAAKEFTSDLSFGKDVQVEAKGKDRYGRTIGEIILPDGTCLNRELVKAGYAWHYTKYSRNEQLDNLEHNAQTARQGLWTDPHAEAPWNFRRLHKQGVLAQGLQGNVTETVIPTRINRADVISTQEGLVDPGTFAGNNIYSNHKLSAGHGKRIAGAIGAYVANNSGVILQIYPGSFLPRFDIQVGDQLIAINNQPYSEALFKTDRECAFDEPAHWTIRKQTGKVVRIDVPRLDARLFARYSYQDSYFQRQANKTREW